MKWEKRGSLFVPDYRREWIIPPCPQKNPSRYLEYLERQRKERVRPKMAVTFDTFQNNTGIGASPATVSITVGSLTNGAIGICIIVLVPSSFVVSSVTVAGSAASLVANSTATAFQCLTMIYGIAVGTTSGAKSVVITYTGSAASVAWLGISASGVDQATPLNNGANEGTTGALSLAVTSATTDLCFDCVQDNSIAPAGNTQTLMYNEGGTATGASRVTTPAASVTFGWNNDGHDKSHSAANFKAVGGGGATPLRRNSSLNGLGASGPFFHDVIS